MDDKKTHQTLVRLGEVSELRESGQLDRLIATLRNYSQDCRCCSIGVSFRRRRLCVETPSVLDALGTVRREELRGALLPGTEERLSERAMSDLVGPVPARIIRSHHARAAKRSFIASSPAPRRPGTAL